MAARPPSPWDDATTVAAAVRTGAVSATEVVDAAIARFEVIEPKLHTLVYERFDRARAEAAAVPVDPAPPFAGVPIVVKDLGCPLAGEPYAQGTRVLRAIDHRAPADSYLTRRLRAAGFVILGRTNTPELGSTITTEPVATGPTHNPWATDRSPGGSSGGSAAAVAAGAVPLAHGSDGGGSIRIPASACALVGLKPSRGRISKGPAVGESWMGASTDGALTRTVRDAAAVLDVMAGYEPGDPVVAPPPGRPWRAEVGVDPGRLRIGVLDHPASGAPGDPAPARAVAEAADLLADLGHHVEAGWPAALGEEGYGPQFTTVVAVATLQSVRALERLVGRPMGPDDLEPMNLALAHLGGKVSGADYLDTVDALHSWARRTVAWWAEDRFDLLLSPVFNGVPFPLGWLTDPDEGTARFNLLMQYTSPFNLTGQPAVSLPLHWTVAGLPVGVQLVADYGREDVLVRVAAQVEQARPWADRHPPVASVG